LSNVLGVDRIGSKVERESVGIKNGEGPTLEIAVPYLAATYDERMFEELYRRAQLFEVTLGGEMRVEAVSLRNMSLQTIGEGRNWGSELMTRILVMKPRRPEQSICRQT